MQFIFIHDGVIEMNDSFLLLSGVFVLVNGILMLLRPKWFRNLWKVRIAYKLWGEKAASRYYYVLGVFTIAIGFWLIIKFLSQLIL